VFDAKEDEGDRYSEFLILKEVHQGAEWVLAAIPVLNFCKMSTWLAHLVKIPQCPRDIQGYF